MSEIEKQVVRLRRGFRLLTWIVALGLAFDFWEFVRLARYLRAAWGQP